MRHLRAFPLWRLATDPTQLSQTDVLRRLAQGQRPVLLDGACDADGLGRFSYAACNPRARYVLSDVPTDREPHTDAVASHRVGAATQPQPVRAPAAGLWRRLQQVIESWHPLVAIGLLDYELGRAAERLSHHAAPCDLGTPALDFAAYDAIVRHDAERGTTDLLAVDEDAAERLRAVLRQPPPDLPTLRCGPLRSDRSQAQHAAAVSAILEDLRAGNCYQVNLCRWLRASLPADAALPAYLRLREVAPAPLGAFLRLDEDHAADPASSPVILSNSPELFLGVDWPGRRVETRPIKGTRRRGATADHDAQLAAELCASRKDAAEHVMIVDLLRNDLGRIAHPGSVHVEGFLRCVSLPTVHHLVSTVAAQPAAGIGLAELLHATFPGGSITGAPKLAAMARIDALEPQRRGPFYGALGWLSRDGGTLALCIRTAVATRGELVLAVGGGIVLDSTASDEWAETEAKAAAFSRALASA